MSSLIIPSAFIQTPANLYTNQRTATDYIADGRGAREGGTYMPLSIFCKEWRFEIEDKVLASDNYVQGMTGYKYKIRTVDFPVKILYDKMDLTINTRLHTVALWQCSVNELYRHNAKTKLALESEFGKYLSKLRLQEMEDYYLPVWQEYIDAFLDAADWSQQTFLNYMIEHKDSSFGRGNTYGRLIEKKGQDYILSNIGEKEYTVFRKFTLRYWKYLRKNLRIIFGSKYFLRPKYRITALRARNEVVEINPSEEVEIYKLVHWRDRVASGFKGQNACRWPLFYESRRGIGLVDTRLKKITESKLGYTIHDPILENVGFYIDMLNKSMLTTDISTADKLMPLFGYPLDITSYAGAGGEVGEISLSEMSGGTHTTDSNFVCGERLGWHMDNFLEISHPKEVYRLGDNRGLVDSKIEQYLDEDWTKLFIDKTDLILGHSIRLKRPVGAKKTVDSAKKAKPYKLNRVVEMKQSKEELSLSRVTQSLLGKGIVHKLGGPTYLDLLKEARDSEDAKRYFQIKLYHIQDNLDIFRESKVFQKAQRIVEAYFDILFGDNFRHCQKILEKEVI